MRFYMRNISPPIQGGYLDQQGFALPVGIDATNLVVTPGYITTTNPGTLGNWAGPASFTDASGVQQSGIIKAFASDLLAAQTIPAQNWTVSAAFSEGNGAADAFLSLYIGLHRRNLSSTYDSLLVRPSVKSGIRRIYDNSATLGTEFTLSASTQTVTVAGSEVYAQAGDVLLLQCWWQSPLGQAKAVSYEINIGIDQGIHFFDSTTDIAFYNQSIHGPLRQRSVVTT